MRYLPGEPSQRKLAWPDNTVLPPIIMRFNTSADYPPGKGRGGGRAIAAICVCLPECSHKNVLSVQHARQRQSWKGVGKLFRGALLAHSVCCQTTLLTLPNCCECLEILELQQKRCGACEKLTPFLCWTEKPNPLPQSFILQQKQLIHFCVICSLALHFSEVSLEQLVTFLHCLKEQALSSPLSAYLPELFFN